MIWLALDLGSRRVGVAVSDPGGTLALPVATLTTGKDGALPLAEVRELVASRGAHGIVVGLPRRLDGSHGPEAQAAAAVAARLRCELGLPVELWDERLTSVEAERLLVQAGVRRKRRRGATDRIAATLILQGFLDHRAAATATSPPAVET